MALASSAAAGQASDSPETRLKAKGIVLPPAPKPIASYVPAGPYGGTSCFSRAGARFSGGKPTVTGKVGAQLTEEQGYQAARATILNSLAALRAEIGSLDHVRRVVVKLVGWVEQRPRVHAPAVGDQRRVRPPGGGFRRRRAARAERGWGANELPLDIPVEVEIVVEVAPDPPDAMKRGDFQNALFRTYAATLVACLPILARSPRPEPHEEPRRVGGATRDRVDPLRDPGRRGHPRRAHAQCRRRTRGPPLEARHGEGHGSRAEKDPTSRFLVDGGRVLRDPDRLPDGRAGGGARGSLCRLESRARDRPRRPRLDHRLPQLRLAGVRHLPGPLLRHHVVRHPGFGPRADKTGAAAQRRAAAPVSPAPLLPGPATSQS